jgi:hypothetical protein
MFSILRLGGEPAQPRGRQATHAQSGMDSLRVIDR